MEVQWLRDPVSSLKATGREEKPLCLHLHTPEPSTPQSCPEAELRNIPDAGTTVLDEVLRGWFLVTRQSIGRSRVSRSFYLYVFDLSRQKNECLWLQRSHHGLPSE